LVEQPRFRAAFDFMRLRAENGELDEVLADWWQEFSLADDTLRRDMVDQVRQEQAKRPPAPRGPRTPRPARDAAADAPVPVPTEGDQPPASRKRRRRRRKPGGGESVAAQPDPLA